MDIAQLSTTNVILAVVAACLVVQTAGLVLAVLTLRRTISTVTATLERLEADHLRPLLADAGDLRDHAVDLMTGARHVVDQVEDVADRAAAGAQRLLGAIETIDARISGAATAGAGAVHAVVNEVSAVRAGVRAGMGALMRAPRREAPAHGGARRDPPPHPDLDRLNS